MRKLIGEIFDPATHHEYEVPLPSDIARALDLDARFGELGLGLADETVAAIAERRQIYRVLTTDTHWSCCLDSTYVLAISIN
jgi:predicted nucleic acid-binding protein